jgi:hypothetical protein
MCDPANTRGKTFINSIVDTVKLINSNGCDSSAILNLTVIQRPILGPLLGQSNWVYTLTPYNYSVGQQLGLTYNWTISNGIIASGQGTNVVTVQWINSGKGNIKAEVVNSQGCSDTASLPINAISVGIEELNSVRNLVVYPNPFNDLIKVEFKNGMEPKKIIISDLLGNISLLSEESEINLSSLQVGVYLIEVEGANGTIYTRMIFKN